MFFLFCHCSDGSFISFCKKKIRRSEVYFVLALFENSFFFVCHVYMSCVCVLYFSQSKVGVLYVVFCRFFLVGVKEIENIYIYKYETNLYFFGGGL